MRRTFLVVALVVGVVGAVRAEDVVLDGMKSKTPSAWVEETPTNKMRFAQFRLPKAKDDKEDAELVVFKGLGGGAEANVDRWKKQFKAPAGKSLDDVAKVEKIKVGDLDATQLTVEGTFLYNPAPFNPRSKTEARPGYKMIAIYFEGSDPYQIKFTGPAKTVESHQKGFEQWVKGFKK
jgi:hypothetical protein